MFITRNLNQFKRKRKKHLHLKKMLNKFTILIIIIEGIKIYLRTEEDYQIMIMFMNKEQIIYLGFYKYRD